MKEAIPQSNWERFFSKVVQAEGESIKKDWEKLYELRNQVAHNRSLNKAELNQISTLVSKLKPKLETAINSLNKLEVSDEEREFVTENVVGETDYQYNYIPFEKEYYDSVEKIELS